jgi:hypothetical protein
MSAPAVKFLKTNVRRAFCLCHVVIVETRLTPHGPSHVLSARVIFAITFFVFKQTVLECRKVCASVRGFIWRHSIILCISGCPKIILDAGLVASVKLQFPGQHFHLPSFLWILFCGDNYKPRSVSVQSILDKNCGGEFNNSQVRERLRSESFSAWEFPSPSSHAEPSYVSMDTISSTL